MPTSPSPSPSPNRNDLVTAFTWFLADRRATLVGRSFSTIKPDDRERAAEYHVDLIIEFIEHGTRQQGEQDDES